MPENFNDLPPTDFVSDQPSLLTRRGALRLLTLTGAGLLAGTGSSQAFMNFFSSFGEPSSATLEDLKIPTEWRAILGARLPSYVGYLHRLRLKNISVREIIEPHTRKRGRVQNTLPPRALWGNIRATLKVMDALSDRLDLEPKALVSVYRSPAYNARCRGAKRNSYHIRNNAIDMVFPCRTGKVAAMARAMRASGMFRGGVGRYGGFTHVDTRGANVDW